MNHHTPASFENYRHRSLAIGLLAFGQTVVWATLFYVFPAMILQWEASHPWSKVQITGAITLSLLLSAIASPVVGRLIDRGAGALVLSGGAACGALCVFLLSWVNALWQFYVLWALIGTMLAACLYEPCFMLVTRAYGDSAKRSIITITLIAGFASTISFPAVHFIALHYGWQAVTKCFGVTALLLGAPALYYGAAILEQHAVSGNRAGSRGGALRLRDHPLVIQLGLCFALLAVVHGATLHHLLPVLKDRELSAGHAVLVASLIGPMQVAGRLVMTALQQRVTHRL
ncbi:MAG: MFS transporter, partial [Pseudomonadota bacterium]